MIHFAAESHVDNSIAGPEAFIKTNVFGTFTLLDVARRLWMKAPFTFHEGKNENRFLHISTDEVFGTLGEWYRLSQKKLLMRPIVRILLQKLEAI
ncbi:MAG: GDP-mannose 4,6-dehydratase [Cyclobacteriaceae bacterium]